MELSNEESILDLEEWDANEVDYFVWNKSESFSFLLQSLSLKTLEDEENVNFNEVKLDDKEGRWLDSVFESGKDSLGGLNLGRGSSLGWLPKLEEEEWTGGWWCSTLESCVTLEICWEKDGLIADSNDDLDRFLNVVLVDSNLYETRYVKLASWKSDFKCGSGSSGVDSIEDPDK